MVVLYTFFCELQPDNNDISLYMCNSFLLHRLNYDYVPWSSQSEMFCVKTGGVVNLSPISATKTQLFWAPSSILQQ